MPTRERVNVETSKRANMETSKHANALNNYLDRIHSLSRACHFLYRKSTTSIERAMEELSNILPEID
jgi:hypothetical protein